MNLSNQNLESNLSLLAAQNRMYAKAKVWVNLIFFFSLTPVIIWILNKIGININEGVLTISGLAGLVSSIAVDHFVNRKIEDAAKVQEEFDLNIFGMEWNESLVGSKVPKETRIKSAGDYKMPPERLPWYTPEISQVNDANIQILLCQRENVKWDRDLKEYIATVLSWCFYITLFALLIYGYCANPNPSAKEFIITVLVPFSGFLVATWKLWHSFKEAGRIYEDLHQSIVSEIESFKRLRISIPTERLRLFQDNIFKYRKKNCLVPDFIYKILQSGYQKRTSRATQEYITEINS